MDLLKTSQAKNDYTNIIEMNAYRIENRLSKENATRVTDKTASILDHIITNQKLDCKINMEDHSISDHKIIYVRMKKNIKKNKEKIKKSYINTDLWLTTLQNEINQVEVKSFKTLTEIIKITKKQCTKEREIKIKEQNYWVTNEYINKIKERDKLYIRWKKVGSKYTETEYKKLRNETNNLRKRLQKAYAEKKF